MSSKTQLVVQTQAMLIKTQKILAPGQTEGEIRLAWNVTRHRSPDELEEQIEHCGLLLVYVTADDAKASQHAKHFGRAVNRQKRALREGFAVVDQRGTVTRIDRRVTGDPWEEIQKRLGGINRDELLTVAQAREVMREVNREAWANAREQARPASSIESRIADCGHMEDRRLSGADALAARSETDRLEASQFATAYGAKIFAARLFTARLDDIGIVIARVTAADERALEALRRDEDRKRTAAETNRENYQGNRFAPLPGELIAVTRNGDLYPINPAKLDDAARLLPDTLPGVIEARGQVANRLKAEMDTYVSKPFSLIAAIALAAGTGARNPISAGNINAPRSADHHILVVDDVSDVLVTVGAFLMKEGFAVQKASTGDEALRLIANDPRVDVLVSDFAMPGLSGTELIAQAVQMRPNLRALVITGYPNADGLADLPPHTTILVKPFRRATLIARIRSLLDDMQPVVNENAVELAVYKEE